MTHRRFFALVAMFVVLSATSYADISDGLVSAWTFDGVDADDAFGNSHGILHNGAEVIDDGYIGKALDVDGVEAYLEAPDVDAFDVMENAYSISAWMNVRAGRDHSAVVWKGVKVGWGSNFTARLCTVSDTDMTWGACNGSEGWFRTDGVYSTGEWTHITMVADGENVTGYVNTEIFPSAQNNPRPVPAPYVLFKENPFEMGVGRAVGGNHGNDSYLDGSIDEVYLYDRGLTEDEIAELAGGARPPGVDSALGVDANGKVATAWGSLKAHR